MSVAPVPAIDMNKLNPSMAPSVTDPGIAVHSGMVVIDEELGPYRALAGGPMNCRQLAAPTKTDERYRRERGASQAAGGYLSYDAKADKFSRREEQAFALAREDGCAYLSGALEPAWGSLAAVRQIAESFRTGAGMGSDEHVDGVVRGCEKFFRPGYAANLVGSWIPTLHDVKEKLQAGAQVADVGCGKYEARP
jgi:hypothetical protein